jgi:hypothetical protein
VGKGGVGLFFEEQNGKHVVRRIIPGGSAQFDGTVAEGDMCVAVDGRNVLGISQQNLKDQIVGDIHTFVELTFESSSGEKQSIYTVSLERRGASTDVSGLQDHTACEKTALALKQQIADLLTEKSDLLLKIEELSLSQQLHNDDASASAILFRDKSIVDMQKNLAELHVQIKCCQDEADILRKERNTCYADIAHVRKEAAAADDAHMIYISDLRTSFEIMMNEQLMKLRTDLLSISAIGSKASNFANESELEITTRRSRQSLNSVQQLRHAQEKLLVASKCTESEKLLQIELDRINTEIASSMTVLHEAQKQIEILQLRVIDVETELRLVKSMRSVDIEQFRADIDASVAELKVKVAHAEKENDDSRLLAENFARQAAEREQALLLMTLSMEQKDADLDRALISINCQKDHEIDNLLNRIGIKLKGKQEKNQMHYAY